MTNEEIARGLREHAAELVRGGENLYRVRAFRQAAMAVLGLTDEVAELIAAGGPKTLERVPGIGKSLAGTIASLAMGCGHRPDTDHAVATYRRNDSMVLRAAVRESGRGSTSAERYPV